MKIIFILSIFLMGIKAFGTECFEIKLNGSPQSIPDPEVGKETWCYRTLNHPDYKTMIFNFDGKKITDKLGILIGKENNFLFFDQYLGKLRVIEQIGSSFNPYQIPLSFREVKKEMKSGEDIKKISLVFSQAQNLDLDKMVQQMINSDKKTLDFSKKPGINSIKDFPSDEEAYLPDDQQPLDGYWWPFRDAPMNSENSPTRLYDLYVNFKTGQDPKSEDWEANNHSLQTVFWGGHCNGWAASTILYGFFDQSLILDLGDEGKKVIDPLKIQGMRTEDSYCVKRAFYGNRYYGMGDDMRDISPAEFHKNIRYYLKELGKPIALDRIPNEIVDTSIYSGYKLKVEKQTENKYHVTATMRTHFYSDDPVFVKKVATIKELTYSYTLETDKDGNITGGDWDDESTNPDFLWVPLAQMDCKGENPNIDPNKVEEMIQTLPKTPYSSTSTSI